MAAPMAGYPRGGHPEGQLGQHSQHDGQAAYAQNQSHGFVSGAGQQVANPNMAREPLDIDSEFRAHPLYQPFLAAFLQATNGKGVRHGGAVKPFYTQQWVQLANQHGTGFLTGQSAKKINEAADRVVNPAITQGIAQIGDGAWTREILGSLVYGGMAYLHATGQTPK